jgi:hypothetical protein
MNWKNKVSRGINQGIDQSKIFFGKAKQQALTIGEQTLLDAEIKELNNKETELYVSLGKEMYALLMNKGRSSVSLRTPEIKDFFSEIEQLVSELATKNMLVEKDEKNSK